MPITYPLDLTVPPKREIKAGDLMSLFQVIADKFNAGIVNGDLSPSGAFDGAKLATRSIPANRLVAADITTAEIGAKQVKTANLDDLAVTAAQIANTTILEGKIKLATFDWALPASITNNGGVSITTGFTVSQVRPLGVYLLRAGIPGGNDLRLFAKLHHDTATGIIHIEVNAIDLGSALFVPVPSTGITARFVGVYLS